MVKAYLRGWGASKQSYSCLGSWVNRLGKFTGPVSILMQTQSTRPKAHWVGRYKWLDNHPQPSTDINLVYSCLLMVCKVEPWRLSSLWTSHFHKARRSAALKSLLCPPQHQVSLVLISDSFLNGPHRSLRADKIRAELMNEFTLSGVRVSTCSLQLPSSSFWCSFTCITRAYLSNETRGNDSLIICKVASEFKWKQTQCDSDNVVKNSWHHGRQRPNVCWWSYVRTEALLNHRSVNSLHSSLSALGCLACLCAGPSTELWTSFLYWPSFVILKQETGRCSWKFIMLRQYKNRHWSLCVRWTERDLWLL